jgi:membrane protease subunit HflK
LTGDLNIMRAEAIVGYRVADPLAFVRRGKDVGRVLRRLAEASLGRALAGQGIDATLRDGRSQIAQAAERELARALERYGLGLSVTGVSLTDVRPPPEVASDFAQAQAARSEHDRRVNEARTYFATTGTSAEATAKARLEQARARADRTLTLARSRATRFLMLQAEAEQARALTFRRIYLEAVRELLPKVRRKIVLTPDEPLDLSILGNDR